MALERCNFLLKIRNVDTFCLHYRCICVTDLNPFANFMTPYLLTVLICLQRTQHLLLTVEEADIECMHSAGIHPIILLLQCTPPHLQTDMEKQQEKLMQKVLYRHEYGASWHILMVATVCIYVVVMPHV